MNRSSFLSMAAGIQASAHRTPEKIALIQGERRLTYAELNDRIDRVANAGAAMVGERLAKRAMIIAPNRLEFMEVVLGLAKIGWAVATPTPRLTEAELATIIEDCQPALIIADPSVCSKLAPSPIPFLELGPAYEAWLAQSNRGGAWVVDEREPFAIPYTSGTTGKPKGVLLSHRSRTLTALAMAVEFSCYGPDDVHLAVAPLCHGAGFAFVHAGLQHGGTCELLSSFDPEFYLRRLADAGATSTFLVPTHFHDIFGLSAATLERYRSRWGGLKTIISNAASLPTTSKLQVLDYFGEGRLFECYGSTEAGIVSALRPMDQRRKTQCVGQAFPLTEIKIVDASGQRTGEGEVGELFSRSPYSFEAYLDRPEDTLACFDPDQWLSVGDLARRDDEGFIYIVGRKKDMLICGGMNVYPKEIEDILCLHPSVAECAVIGMPDDRLGERPKAFIVLRPDATLDAEALQAWVRMRLAPHKTPREYVAAPALPKSPTGKVLKAALRGDVHPA